MQAVNNKKNVKQYGYAMCERVKIFVPADFGVDVFGRIFLAWEYRFNRFVSR